MRWEKIWSDRPYPPFLMNLVAKATVNGFRKIFKESEIKISANYWMNGSNSYYYKKSEFDNTVKKISLRAIKSPSWLYKYFKRTYSLAKSLRKYMESINLSLLTNSSDDELLAYINDFSKKFEKMYSYATLAPLIGYSTENPIYKKIEKIMQNKTKGNLALAADYLITMTIPPLPLKIHRQELEVLRLAQRAKKARTKNKKELFKKYYNELNNLKEKYAWLSFDLVDKISWDLNYYANLVFENMNIKIEQRIRELRNYKKIAKEKFNKLCRQLNISKEEQEIFKLVANLGYYKWARQYEFQKALFLLKFIQDELGKRCKLNSLESKYLLAGEYRRDLLSKSDYKKIVKERFFNFLIIDKINKTLIFQGEKAKKEFIKLRFEEKIKIKKFEIKGTSASLGYARGVVKIINTAKDMRKMNNEDILISQATTPEIILAMKKAAAIVTNEGGIICHAAIVSRELKIPCVVGTRIATKVFKDGDRVEVDANQGVVRILNRK